MKKLFLLLTLMLSIMVMSCGPSHERAIVRQYVKESVLCECTLRFPADPAHPDSSNFSTIKYYVLAKDIPDARLHFETEIVGLANTLQGVETYWKAIPLHGAQPYPYSN